MPAINYLRTLGHRRFFLVGSDHIYSRTTNAVLKGYLASLGIAGDMIAERYVAGRLHRLARAGRGHSPLRQEQARGVIATITGDANLHFFRELARRRVTAATIPVMSLSINEAELPALMRSNMAGHMVAWNYLHAVDRRENRAFIADWRRFTGQPKAMTNDSMEATWIGFQLWTEAVEAAGTTEIDKVRAALGGRQIAAPSGFTVKMDGRTHHLYKPVMIGRISKDGLILPVWATEGLVPPEPWSPWLAANAPSGSRAGPSKSPEIPATGLIRPRLRIPPIPSSRGLRGN